MLTDEDKFSRLLGFSSEVHVWNHAFKDEQLTHSAKNDHRCTGERKVRWSTSDCGLRLNAAIIQLHAKFE